MAAGCCLPHARPLAHPQPSRCLRRCRSKHKNHTAHNQTRKNHRNGRCSRIAVRVPTVAIRSLPFRRNDGRLCCRPLGPAGIKRPKSQRYMSLKGVDPKFLRNQRYAAKGTKKATMAVAAKA